MQFNGDSKADSRFILFSCHILQLNMQISILLDYAGVLEALPLIWHAEDQTIFAGIISFYFGQRAFVKLR